VPQDPLCFEERLELIAVPGIGLIGPGDDLPLLIANALRGLGPVMQDNKAVVVVTSKVLSRAQGRFVDVSTVQPSARARELAQTTGKDPRVVELILSESQSVSRATRGVLIVRHVLGFVAANAGIDESNAQPKDAKEGSGPWVLLMPRDPDGAARALRARIQSELGVSVGVVITDSRTSRLLCWPRCACTRRTGSAYGIGRNSIRSTTESTATLAPMPRAKVSTAPTVNHRARTSDRSA